MGAHNFSNTIKGDDPEEAYNELVEQATYDYGHDPYNGTISTTSGWKLAYPSIFTDEDKAREFADDDIDNAFKWEAAHCVKFMRDDEVHLLFYGWAAC